MKYQKALGDPATKSGSDIHRFSFKLKDLGETESLLQKTLF